MEALAKEEGVTGTIREVGQTYAAVKGEDAISSQSRKVRWIARMK
jgi:hypothetical protein